MADRHEEFTSWARQRQNALLRTAVLLTGDRQRAEDLVQEALTQVAVRWGRLREGSPEAYARRVILTRNISWWRRRRHEVLVEVGVEVAGADPAASADRRILLDRALATLTPAQRAVIVLRYYDDLSEVDTASALGVAVGTVKSQAHAAIARLRSAAPELAELLGEETR
jgi:RNA polymerase sigma-70 factor (sigma-E family)